MGKYTTIQLPHEFILCIDMILNERQELGFKSRADVVKTAVRDFFEKNIGNWTEFEVKDGKLTSKKERKNN